MNVCILFRETHRQSKNTKNDGRWFLVVKHTHTRARAQIQHVKCGEYTNWCAQWYYKKKNRTQLHWIIHLLWRSRGYHKIQKSRKKQEEEEEENETRNSSLMTTFFSPFISRRLDSVPFVIFPLMLWRERKYITENELNEH